MNKLILLGLLLGCNNKNFKLKDKPLLEAARSGNLVELRESLKHEDVNMVREDGMTALMLSAQNGYVEAIRELISAGADVNQLSPGGSTALMLAGQKGHPDAIKALIEFGANVKG